MRDEIQISIFSCSARQHWRRIFTWEIEGHVKKWIQAPGLEKPATLFFRKPCSSESLVLSKTSFFRRSCSSENLVLSKTLFFQKPCFFEDLVFSKTLFFRKPCSFENLVLPKALFFRKPCSFEIRVLPKCLYFQSPCSFEICILSKSLSFQRSYSSEAPACLQFLLFGRLCVFMILFPTPQPLFFQRPCSSEASAPSKPLFLYNPFFFFHSLCCFDTPCSPEASVLSRWQGKSPINTFSSAAEVFVNGEGDKMRDSIKTLFVALIWAQREQSQMGTFKWEVQFTLLINIDACLPKRSKHKGLSSRFT